MKKFLGILLTVAILVSCFSTAVFAADVTLKGDTVYGTAGETAKVTFTVSEVTYSDYGYVISALDGLTIEKINSGVASHADEDAEEFVTFIANKKNGKVGAAFNINVTKNGVLFTVTVKVPADAQPGDKFEVKLAKDNGLTKANGSSVGEVISSGWVVICDHDYRMVSSTATCEDNGVETWKCSVCGDKYTKDGTALGHDYAETWSKNDTQHWHECSRNSEHKTDIADHDWTLVSDTATCHEGGEETYECSVCDATKTEDSDATGNHTWSGEWTTDEDDHWKVCTNDGCTHTKEKGEHIWKQTSSSATCGATGLAQFECETCGRTKTENVGATGDHNYSTDWSKNDTHHWHECVCGDKADYAKHSYKLTSSNPATCTKKGEKVYTCECGHSYTEEIDMLDHDHSDDWSTNDTHHWHACSCGDKADYAKHSWKLVKDTATCGKAGKATYKCSVCGATKTEDSNANGDHHHELVSDTATCGKAGIKTYKCSCGDTYTEESAATGKHTYETKWSKDADKHWHECSVCGAKADADEHDWELVKDTATCGKAGKATYMCSVCGETKTEVSNANGDHHHELVSDTATCGKAGIKTYKCSCGDTYTEESAATGKHTYETKWSKDADKHWHECSVCGAKADAENHDWDLVKDTATCGKAGEATYKCSVCGSTKTEVSNASGDHHHELVSDTATCGKAGIKTYKCSCGDTYTEESAATGKHTYETEWSVDGTHHWHVCSVCGAKGDHEEHDLHWHVIKKPTGKKTGLKQNICEICGYVKEEAVIPTVEGLDDVPETGDITAQLTFGVFAAVMAIAAAAWVVLKRKFAK